MVLYQAIIGLKNLNSMKKHLILFLTLLTLTLSSCGPDKSKNGKSRKNSIVGTWKLIEYSDFDSKTNSWTNPYGNNPRGYFTYTKSGIVNLNGSSEAPLVIPTDSIYTKNLSLGALLDNAFGYFGTYTIDSLNSIITHHVKGGSVIPYIGTDQPREYIIKGDTLLIGDPSFGIGKRILIRVD